MRFERQLYVLVDFVGKRGFKYLGYRSEETEFDGKWFDNIFS